MSTLLVTGSRGLIGRELVRSLLLDGHNVRGFDWSYPLGHHFFGNILDRSSLQRAMSDCDGIIHLAAISRVAWGERDPVLCYEINAQGTDNLLQVAARQFAKPWVLVASSREVYGEPGDILVTETQAGIPVNHYGRSKLAAEQLINATAGGLTTAILRFANVYGSQHDHADRVIPAFMTAAIEGRRLSVHGASNTFDFTHVGDVVRGIRLAIHYLATQKRSLGPIHLATGRGTSLGELAEIIVALLDSPSAIERVGSRAGFVSRFVGDPRHAQTMLDFRCRIGLEAGLAQLAIEMADPNDRRYADFPAWKDAVFA